MNRIGFIGGGQMATALAAGIAKSQASKFSIAFSDPNDGAAERFEAATTPNANVHRCDSSQDVIDQSEVVILAVKPHLVSTALNGCSFRSNPLFISVVAGVDFDRLTSLTQSSRIIRAMPNTPCLIGKGAIGYAAPPDADTETSSQDLATAKELLSAVGTAVNVAPHLLDAVTGLSGSGPAFVFTFIEAMIDGGVLVGLPRSDARSLAIQTVLGASQMLEQLDAHPATLRDQVTSPGGTTIAGLKSLESQAFRDAVMSAVSAATNRATELGQT